MSIVIQDNFLDKIYFQSLQNEVLSYEFPWHMSVINQQFLDKNTPSYNQMTHSVLRTLNLDKSDFYQKLGALFDVLELLVPIRIKLNLQIRQEKIIEHGMHIDIVDAPENALTSILYMNTNNGYTKFETGEKVESVENRLVTFPNSLKHTGSTNNCEVPYRCVMNIDWIPKIDIVTKGYRILQHQ